MIRRFISLSPIILLLISSFIVRTLKIEKLFYFSYDESIPAFVGRRLILWHHVPLIGGVTPFNFHLGPYFYWFLSFVLFIGKLNPIAWGWAGAIFAVVTTLLMYFVGKNFESKKIGFLASAFWAFSYLANVYDRHFWALYWGPFVSLLILLCLHKVIKGQEKFIYLLAPILAFTIHADPSNLVFLIFCAVVWFTYKIPVKKSTIIALLVIVLSFAPLVVFDLRHNFSNITPAGQFLASGRNNPGFEIKKFTDNLLLFPRAFSRLIYVFGDKEIAKQYSYCRIFVREKYEAVPSIFIFLASIVLITFTLWALVKSQNRNNWRLIAILLLIYFIGIQIYGTIFKSDIFEHYLTGIFAPFLLIFAKVIGLLPKKLVLVVLAVFIAANLYKFSVSDNGMGLSDKKQAIAYTMSQVGERQFSLDSLSTCWKYSGYRYLFTAFGKEPVKSYVDPNFSYLYGATPVAAKHPQTVVTFVTHDFVSETNDFYTRYNLLKSHEVGNAVFGNIEVMIIDNSADWYDKGL